MSEKLDGWFAKWDGARFTTASGATISAPGLRQKKAVRVGPTKGAANG